MKPHRSLAAMVVRWSATRVQRVQTRATERKCRCVYIVQPQLILNSVVSTSRACVLHYSRQDESTYELRRYAGSGGRARRLRALFAVDWRQPQLIAAKPRGCTIYDAHVEDSCQLS